MEIERQMKEMASQVKVSGVKVLNLYPLKKREDAYSNQSRRVFLAYLLDGSIPNRFTYTAKEMRLDRETLEYRAGLAGYTINEVES